MPERPSALGQLALEVGAEHARLHAREARDRVDVEHLRQAREVERDHRARLAGRRLEAAGDAGAAAERDQHRVRVEHRAHDRLHARLVRGPHDGVGQPPELAAALAHEVAQALAAAVHDAVVGVGRDVRDGLERRAQRAGQLRLRDRAARRTRAARRPRA